MFRRPDEQMGPGAGRGGRYLMRHKLLALGDDYYIENALGQRVYFVDGKAFRLREHLAFKDSYGHELLSIKDTYSIYRQGQVLATVKKALMAPFRQRFDIHVAAGGILEHEYEIHDGRRRVAEISKKWFRVADTYGVDIAPGANDILLLACTAIIDMMTAEGR